MQQHRGRLAAIRGRLRRSLTDRRLGGLPRRSRALALVLMGLTAATMGFLALVLAVSKEYAENAFVLVRFGVSLIVLLSVGLGVAVVGATRTPVAAGPGRARRRSFSDALLSLAAVSVLLTLACVDAAADIGLNTPQTMLVRALVWLALALALAPILDPRPTRPGPGDIDFDRFRRLVLPSLVLIALAFAVLAVSRSVTAALQFLEPALAVPGLAALVVLPTILVSTTVAGLADTQRRGEQLSALLDRRPYLVVGVVLVRLALIGFLLALGRWLRPDVVLLSFSIAAWSGTLIVGLLVVALLSVERRLGLTTGDHPRIARLAGWVVALPMASVAVFGWLIGVLPDLVHHPGAVIAVGLLVVAVRRLHRASRRLSGTATTALAAASGLIVSLLVLPSTGLQLPATLSSGNLVTVTVVGGLLGLAVVGVVAALVTLAVKTRQLRLAVFLVAVVGWIVIRIGLERVAPDATPLNLDLSLTLLLLVAAATWVTGLQRWVDGFEIVVTTVITIVVIQLPIVLNALPDLAQRGLLVGALLSPGLAAGWRHTRTLAQGLSRREGFRALATSCLAYAALVGLVWIAGVDAGGMVNSLSNLAVDYLAVPLALLLVAAGSVARRTAPQAQLTRPD